MKFVNTIGYNVFNDDLEKISFYNNTPRVVNTISPNSYGIALNDNEFSNALKNSDFLVLDGVYFALSSLLTQGKNIKRNQGPDVFRHFIAKSNENNGRVFFLGSTEDTLKRINERINIEFPNVIFNSFSPPFTSVFTDEVNDLMISKINAFEPDVLFVGMTCPKQEKWAIKNKDKIKSSLIICIGNVFDWYAGTQKSISPIWFKLRLGWLVRIFLRPEIFRRNIGNQLAFFFDLFLIILKIKK